MPQATLRCGAEWRCRCCDGAAALAEHEESASLLRHRADRQGGLACSAAVRSRARARVGRRRRWRVPMIDTRPVGLRCALSLSLVSDSSWWRDATDALRCSKRRARRPPTRASLLGRCRLLPSFAHCPRVASSSAQHALSTVLSVGCHEARRAAAALAKIGRASGRVAEMETA